LGFRPAAHRSGRGARALFLTGALAAIAMGMPRLLIAQEAQSPSETQVPPETQAPPEPEPAASVLSIAYTTDGPVDAD